jgi:hypothetical protein
VGIGIICGQKLRKHKRMAYLCTPIQNREFFG